MSGRLLLLTTGKVRMYEWRPKTWGTFTYDYFDVFSMHGTNCSSILSVHSLVQWIASFCLGGIYWSGLLGGMLGATSLTHLAGGRDTTTVWYRMSRMKRRWNSCTNMLAIFAERSSTWLHKWDLAQVCRVLVRWSVNSICVCLCSSYILKIHSRDRFHFRC